jgi:uncharacterized protein YndB with AHSA1/START domain
MAITEKQIVKSAQLDCSPDTAWRKWTTHEGLLTFFGADNKIELKPGGAFEIYFSKDAPEGLRGSEGCKVLSFLPQQMFSFSWNSPPSIMEARESGIYTWVVIIFKPISDIQTEIVLTHLGWPEGKLWEQVYNYFNAAWGRVIENLENSCKK